jgi:hypothetical protein
MAPPTVVAQVLDDSTKEHIRRKVDDAAVLAIQDGHPVQVWLGGAPFRVGLTGVLAGLVQEAALADGLCQGWLYRGTRASSSCV